MSDFVSQNLYKNSEATPIELSQIFYKNPVPMAINSLADYGFIEINEAFIELIGYTREELIGRSTDDIGFFCDGQYEVRAKLRSNDPIRDIELKFKTKDGKILTGLFSGDVVLKSGKEYYLTAIVDITELKNIQKELNRAKEQAELASLMKNRFLANISHEIRTPISVITGYIELMQRTQLTEEQKEYCEEVNSASGQLLSLITDILDISRIESGKLRLNVEVFNIKDLVTSVISLLRIRAEEKAIGLSYEIFESVPLWVEGDETRLKQVLFNLISNSIKFTHSGMVSLSIDKESSKKKDYLIISVKDTGIGISEDDKRKLFKPFVQIDQSDSRNYGGVGLGLSISREIVKLMKGDIIINSVKGKGSDFIVTLPLKEAKEPFLPQNEVVELNDNQSLDLRVLLVDDSIVNRRMMGKLLSTSGIMFDEAQNGCEALEAVKRSKYDLVLMDCQMPVMDGYSATREIRDFESGRDRTYIIAMTAHAMEGDRQKCIDSGMDGYLSKPVHLEDLMSIFSEVARKKSQAKGLVEVKLSGLSQKDIEEMLHEYKGYFEEKLNELDNYLEARDFTSLKAMAHQLKGSTGSYGLNEMYMKCLYLENLAHDKNYDKCRDLIGELRELYHIRFEDSR